MRARIEVKYKPGVPDDQSKETYRKLHEACEHVVAAKEGTFFYVSLENKSLWSAYKDVSRMCRQPLTQVVTQEYSFTLFDDGGKEILSTPWFYFENGRWRKRL